MTTNPTPGLEVLGEIGDSLEHLIFGAIGLTAFALTDASASDLTLAQWRALVVIGRDNGIRVGVLASRVGMSLPSTSRMVRRLERAGHVITERDSNDRRATLVHLTGSGRRTRNAVIQRRRELMNSAVADCGVGLPADLAQGLAALARAFAPYE
jgi:DNA-binding MarR family transcriptional regulator